MICCVCMCLCVFAYPHLTVNVLHIVVGLSSGRDGCVWEDARAICVILL